VGKRSIRRRWLSAGAIAVLVLAGFFLVPWRNRQLPDPRRSYPTPYLNVQPEVAYVGLDRCADCHWAQAERYKKHPMGNSIAAVTDCTVIEKYDVHNPFKAVGFEYSIRKAGSRVFHQEKKRDPAGQLVFEQEEEVHFGVGSGHSGRGYLINRNGFLFLSPITWYRQEATWDLSPGYSQTPNHPHFARPVIAECLFCHANHEEPIPSTINHYRQPIALQAIGCERCHGPGALHVARRDIGEGGPLPDWSIVNPARLAPALRDAVCEQCHLHPEISVSPRGRNLLEYRPGLPLHLFQSVFLLAPEARDKNKFGGRVEQMQTSACYQKSAGKLGCISCHDPHGVPAANEKIAFYRNRCLNCHRQDRKDCSVPLAERLRRSKADDCAGCHMPYNPTNFIHVSLTDHRVQRPGRENAGLLPASGQLPLVHFYEHLLERGEDKRDLGIALVYYAGPRKLARILAKAVSILESHLRNCPDDVEALDALGVARLEENIPTAALECFEKILAVDPNSERALTKASSAAAAVGEDKKALGYLEQAIKINPYSASNWVGLGHLCMRRAEWAKAAEAVDQSLRLSPASLDARRLAVIVPYRQGKRAQAVAAWQAFAAFEPPDKDAMRRLLDGPP